MSATDPSVAFCLERIGKTAAGWDTLVVSGSAVAQQSADQLWAAWADLESWLAWSPLHLGDQERPGGTGRRRNL